MESILELAPLGGMIPVAQLDEQVIAVEKPHSWKSAAQDLSQIAPGQWWPRDTGITWVCGAKTAYILDRNNVHSVVNSRGALADLKIEPGWTVGGCARRLLSWLNITQKPGDSVELLRDAHGYYDCAPGWYPAATLLDVQSCYWHLFDRLPSLRVGLHANGGVQWYPMTVQEAARREKMAEVIGWVKPLRNTMVGACLGSMKPRAYFCKGERCTLNLGPGPLAPAARLVIRTGYELTRRAAQESDSILSCVDSVITPHACIPSAWSNAGLKVRTKSHGDAEIVRSDVYRIGSVMTESYRRGDRLWSPVPRATPPPVEYGAWLAAVV